MTSPWDRYVVDFRWSKPNGRRTTIVLIDRRTAAEEFLNSRCPLPLFGKTSLFETINTLATMGSFNEVKLDYDVMIIGAGLSGIFTLYRMKQLGLKVRVLETGSAEGGTWFW